MIQKIVQLASDRLSQYCHLGDAHNGPLAVSAEPSVGGANMWAAEIDV